MPFSGAALWHPAEHTLGGKITAWGTIRPNWSTLTPRACACSVLFRSRRQLVGGLGAIQCGFLLDASKL